MGNVSVETKMPIHCGDCPFYSERTYRCHNEIGKEATCSMGYMKGQDMRDKTFKFSKFEGCKLGEGISREV